jgi:hypothetical protein
MLRVASRQYGLSDDLLCKNWHDLTAGWHERARRRTLGLQQARSMAATTAAPKGQLNHSDGWRDMTQLISERNRDLDELANIRGELANIQKKIKEITSCVSSTWWFLLMFMFFYPTNNWEDSLWYSIRYGVNFSDVQTDRPKDCDFMRAPLGDKGCSYKAHVQVFDAEGVLVAGENAPIYGSDTKTAKPIVSYDGGKNWDSYSGATVPNPKPISVRVSWVKE